MYRALSLVLVAGFVSPAAAAQETDQRLGGQWSYHWGDLPAPSPGHPMFTAGWPTVAPLQKAPGRAGERILWLDIPLPAGAWPDPSLLFASVDGAFSVYAQDRLVYRSGRPLPNGEETQETTSWHLFAVGPSDLGHDLLVRIQSPSSDAGIARGAFIGPRADLVLKILKRGLGSAIVALLLFFAALVALVAWIPRRTDPSLLVLAAFSLVAFLLVFGFSEATLLVFPHPYAVNRIMWVSVCLFAPALAWCLATVLPALKTQRTAPPLLILTAIGVGGAMIMLADPVTQVFLLISVAVLLGVLVVGVAVCVIQAIRGDREALALAVGFGLLFFTGLIDCLPVFGLTEPGQLWTHWGFLCMVAGFGWVIVQRANQLTDTLAARTRHLEERQSDVLAFSERLETSAQGLATIVEALRRSSDATTQGVTQQAASVRETQVTADEIRRTSAVAAEKAGRMLEAATEAEAAGKAGEAAVEQSLRGLGEIATEVTEMTQRISAAGRRTREIAGIVASVKDFAAQSNMLALNAAIEAVRSGEAGRGFAVVAREVRRLADESLQATARIKEVLDGLTESIAGAVEISEAGAKRVAAGLAQVRASGDQLQRLTGIVQQTSGHVRQISAAVTQQNAGVAQIVAAISDLSGQMKGTLERARDGESIALQVQEVVATMRTGAEVPAEVMARSA